MGWSKAGKGSPSTNAAERALLEGYRMGLNSGKKADGNKGKTGWATSKGTGKGGATGKGPGAKPECRTCQREGCRAATNKQATWGGGTACHCCGLSLTATLPVEQLLGWAFQLRMDARAGATPPKTAQKAPAATGRAAPNVQPSTEQLAATRVERLSALKNVGAPPTTPATPLQ